MDRSLLRNTTPGLEVWVKDAVLTRLKSAARGKVCVGMGPTGNVGDGMYACGLERGEGWGKWEGPPVAGTHLPCLCFFWKAWGSNGQATCSFFGFSLLCGSPEFRIKLFSLVMEFDFQLVKIKSSHMALWLGPYSSFLSVYTDLSVIRFELYLKFPWGVFLGSEKQLFSHPLFPV